MEATRKLAPHLIVKRR